MLIPQLFPALLTLKSLNTLISRLGGGFAQNLNYKDERMFPLLLLLMHVFIFVNMFRSPLFAVGFTNSFVFSKYGFSK